MSLNSFDKQKLAEHLFDEIGEIDDYIIASAESFRPAKSKAFIRKVAVAALAAALSISLILGVLVVNMDKKGNTPSHMHDSDKNQDSDNVQNGNVSDPLPESPSDEDSAGEGISARSLSSNLYYMKETVFSDRISEEDIKFFDGKARLIWKFTDEEFYRVCAIDASKLAKIQWIIEEKKSTAFSPDSYSSVLEGFWISLGDGKIISPFLISSDGNIGYNKLFSYEAEIEPSEELTQYICDIIERY